MALRIVTYIPHRWEPKAIMELMQTTQIIANKMAYSTAVGPDSSAQNDVLWHMSSCPAAA